MTEIIPARLHGIIARDKNIGIVIRRGPSKKAAIFLWDVSKDKFTLGQWLKGRIYERRCDISDDGKYFLYFAMNGKWQSESKGAWTAVSKLPYLKALDFFPKGNCWEGGGLFVTHKEYYLNDSYYLKMKGERRDSGLICHTKLRAQDAHGMECLSVYIPRLLKYDWVFMKQENNIFIFEKTNKFGLILRKRLHAGGNKKGQSVYWEEHELVSKQGKTEKFPNWEWAEMQDKSIVYAEKGCLYRAKFFGKEMMKAKLLHDFTPYKFEEIKAPY